jgi:transcriptional regulator with PAS, ATPase and Fis domain
MVEKARLLAQVDTPLLLQGETGVGKEIFARAIHQSGPHRPGPFVALNCGGLPRDILASELFGYVDGAFTGARRTGMLGKVEAAQGGTLFLDEIAELPLDLQPYLLRVLEGGEVYPLGSARPRTVQFRLMAATNRDLRGEVGANRFRMDLFYRVSVVSLHIPPLRERTEDIPELVDRFGRDVASREGSPVKRFTPDALNAFALHPWPGNLRELRNVVEAMMLLSETELLGLDALPAEVAVTVASRRGASVPEACQSGLDRVERDAIGAAIRLHGGNLTQAARALRISKSTLYLKVKGYALETVLSEARSDEIEHNTGYSRFLPRTWCETS